MKELFVRGLPPHWGHEEFSEALRRLGPIERARVQPDDRNRTRRNRGSGFVTFRDDDVADALVEAPQTCGGARLEFSPARPRGGQPPHAPPTLPFTTPARPAAPPAPARARAPNDRAAGGLPVPYHFVPIARGHMLEDAPVFHDGSGDAGLLTGELRCELTALTPLLAGNDLYAVADVRGVRVRGDDATLPPAWGVGAPVHREKKVLEPLRLDDGRVAIAGSAIKGTLRQSLGALLSAPMERVAERSYSYRPHLAPNANARRRPRPAIVVQAAAADGTGLHLELLPMLDRNDPRFVFLDNPVDAPPRARRGREVHRYRGGTDAAGELAARFDAQNRPGGAPPRRAASAFVHHWVDLDASLRGASPVDVPAEVVREWRATLDHLADTRDGHLSERHPLLHESADLRRQIAKKVRALKEEAFQVGDLVYCERDERTGRILSIGHHFRYRWRHADTVRTHAGAPRPEMVPTPNERTSPRPEALTGARLLMGYTGDNEGSAGIGRGPFAHLAGRLAPNMAVEQCPDGRDNARFLHLAVPLKILGQPRPSAAEHYLQQDAAAVAARGDLGAMRTWGDVAGLDAPGEIAGRKFYLHQPDAATDARCYRADDPETRRSKQATLARFVSRPGARFRFTLRFRSLRPWELGAVLLALAPTPARARAVFGDDAVIAAWLDDVTVEAAAQNVPALAVKLGHGRPLGLGSVAVTVDALHLVEGDATEALCLEALRKKLGGAAMAAETRAVARQWLKVSRYAGRTRAAYPVAPGRRGEVTVYAHHMNARNAHAKARQGVAPNAPPTLLQPLKK